MLLARWLSPAGYGAYSLALAVFLLFASMHSAVMTEPMLVFGSGRYRAVFGGYLRALLRGHTAVMAAMSAPAAAAAIIAGYVYSGEARSAMLALAAASPAVLLFWLVRRVPYVRMAPGASVMGAAVYFASLAALLGVLRAIGALSAPAAFLAMGAAGLLASGAVLAGGGRGERTGPIDARAAAREHWAYGKWALAGAIVNWAPGHIYYALLPAWLGLEGSAGLRALMNFSMPVLQAISALSTLMLPALVRDRDRGGAPAMTRTMTGFFALFGAGTLVYAAVLWLVRGFVFEAAYGGRYKEYSGLPFLLAALLPAGTCFTSVLGNGLRALERPDLMFRSQLGPLAVALCAGAPLAAKWGVTGALMGLLASSAASGFAMGWFYRSVGRRSV